MFSEHPVWTTLGLIEVLYVLVLSAWIILQRRAPAATLAWIFGLALVPVGGLLVYHFLGPRKLQRSRLKRLRARGSAMPVLILTADDSVEERVKGLDYGADDYMAKPFSLQELEARVRALIRRGMGGASSTIKHGPLVYDQAGRVATIDGQMVELSARELGLLEVLLQRAGRLVSKDQLVERLCEWGEEVSNNAIEVYIHRLRKKIEKGPVRIATVRGLGYCLEKIPG